MLKFAASRQTLPPNYLSKTNKMDLKNFDISKLTAAVKKKQNKQNNVHEDNGVSTRVGTKRKALSDPLSEETKKPATDTNTLKRSVTVQMKVWSSQLNRIKKRTESLRKKDQEIKERFERIQQRAKRVFSMVEKPTFTGVHGESPTKKARRMSGDSVLYQGNDCLLLQRIEYDRKKRPVPARRHKSGSDLPTKSSFDDLLGPIPYPRTFMKNGLKCTKC